jgi:hypothetical protein
LNEEINKNYEFIYLFLKSRAGNEGFNEKKKKKKEMDLGLRFVADNNV